MRIDDTLAAQAASGEALTVNDARRHLLLELPHNFFVDPTRVVEQLGAIGVTSVLTHPERYRYLAGAIEPVEAWKTMGVVVQVTAGSLLGDFGRSAYAYGWRLVHAGLVDVVATDAHDTAARRPRMQDALSRLIFEVGPREANRLCRVNPRRIIKGQQVVNRERGAEP